jgi:hypothetical protein
VETSFSLRELDSQLPALSFVFEAPDNEEAQVAQRFDRKRFVSQALSTPFTVLAHLGAIRPSEGLRLYSTDPAAADRPFDSAWLTLPDWSAQPRVSTLSPRQQQMQARCPNY